MRILAALAPLFLIPVLFVVVLRSGDPPAPWFRDHRPVEAMRADRCTWYCHNHGCTHRNRLPAALSVTLFDDAIAALYGLGGHLGGARATGYGAANLLVFCAAWPGMMYALYLVAVAQRWKLRSRT